MANNSPMEGKWLTTGPNGQKGWKEPQIATVQDNTSSVRNVWPHLAKKKNLPQCAKNKTAKLLARWWWGRPKQGGKIAWRGGSADPMVSYTWRGELGTSHSRVLGGGRCEQSDNIKQSRVLAGPGRSNFWFPTGMLAELSGHFLPPKLLAKWGWSKLFRPPP